MVEIQLLLFCLSILPMSIFEIIIMTFVYIWIKFCNAIFVHL